MDAGKVKTVWLLPLVDTVGTTPWKTGNLVRSSERNVKPRMPLGLAFTVRVVKPAGSVATVTAGDEAARQKVTRRAAVIAWNGRIVDFLKATKFGYDSASLKLLFFWGFY